MQTTHCGRVAGYGLALLGLLIVLGCTNTPIDVSAYGTGPTPLRTPSPARAGGGCCYEDGLTGGQVFDMYCAACHNARSLAERPFSNYKNVAQHMRVRANLTGEEYAKLMAWLRRWHDVPPPNPPVEPSPKRLTFSQPIAELRPQPSAPAAAPGPREAQQPPGPGAGEKP
jgi:hypothetical protein